MIYDSNLTEFFQEMYGKIKLLLNCKITNVPIFNRVWFETESNVKVLFSISDTIDTEVERILTGENYILEV